MNKKQLKIKKRIDAILKKEGRKNNQKLACRC